MEEGAHGPEMAALNPARSKTGFARHTKAPRRAAPRREMRETKKRMREREREGGGNISTSNLLPGVLLSSVNNG